MSMFLYVLNIKTNSLLEGRRYSSKGPTSTDLMYVHTGDLSIYYFDADLGKVFAVEEGGGKMEISCV